MKPRRTFAAPTRAVVWALALGCGATVIATPAGCDRPAGSNAAARNASPPPASQPASDELLIKIAALRDLLAQQPHAADRGAYAAYLVKDESAASLAPALSQAQDGAGGPPVVAALDVYMRKGRTMDAASGRPVKVLQVRIVVPPTPDCRADALATCKAGRLEGDSSYRYRLRRDGGDWVVERRDPQAP